MMSSSPKMTYINIEKISILKKSLIIEKFRHCMRMLNHSIIVSTLASPFSKTALIKKPIKYEILAPLKKPQTLLSV